MEPDDWRASLWPPLRPIIINNLLEILMRPYDDLDMISRIWTLANSIEEGIYRSATSKTVYLRRIYVHVKLSEMVSDILLNPLPPDKDLTDTSYRSPSPPNEDYTIENEARGELSAIDKFEEEELSAKMEALELSHRAGDKSAIENFVVNLFEGDDTFEEFELNQGANYYSKGEEEAWEVSQPWQDEWDDYDDDDDFSVRLKRELEKNKPKE